MPSTWGECAPLTLMAKHSPEAAESQTLHQKTQTVETEKSDLHPYQLIKFLAAGELDEIEVQQCVKHKQKQNTFLTFPYHNRGRST